MAAMGVANASHSVAEVGLEPELPEEKLNRRIFLMAFLYMAMRGFGALAFIWATVVLNGFRVLMIQRDFWFVTIIVLLEGSRIFSGFDKPEDQIFLRLTQAILSDKRIESAGSGSWQRHVPGRELLQDLKETMPELTSTFRSYVYFLMAILRSWLAYAQLASVMVCIIVPTIPLIKQDFVERKNEKSDKYKNIHLSLNIFYGLVLAQGISFIAGTLAGPIKPLKTVCLKYKLGVWGIRALSRYVQENYLKCIKENLPTAVKMDLVTFAKEKVNSDSVEDQLMGVRVLDYLLRKGHYKDLVLTQLRASAQTVGKIVDMLGVKGPDEDTRGHAANIVLELAPYLQIESFPGIVPSISSLLPANKKRIGRVSPEMRAMDDDRDNHESIEFTWLGVQILEKLIHDDAENRIQVKYYTPNLLLNIIDFTSSNAYSSKSDVQKEIAVTSLKIVQRLASSTGDSGDTLRFFIKKRLPIMINIRRILENNDSMPELLVQAAQITALALEDFARQEIGCSRLVIRRLFSLLLVKTGKIFPNGNDDEIVAACAAGQTLVYLLAAVENDYTNQFYGLILSMENFKHSFEVLWGDFTDEHKSIAANVMACSLAAPLVRDLRLAADELNRQHSLPKIMQAIKHAIEKLESSDPSDNNWANLWTEKGKLLESYINLIWQICYESNFENALKDILKFDDVLFNQAGMTKGVFMQKINKLLEFYMMPTTDFPGIRRVTLQLLTWMVRNEQISIELIKECDGMNETLKKALETATGLETYKLFYNGNPCFERNIKDSIYFCATLLLKMLAGEDVREIKVHIQ